MTSSETEQTEAVWEIGKETEEWWLIQEKKKKQDMEFKERVETKHKREAEEKEA